LLQGSILIVRNSVWHDVGWFSILFEGYGVITLSVGRETFDVSKNISIIVHDFLEKWGSIGRN